MNALRRVASLVAAVLVVAGCGAGPGGEAPDGWTFTDDLGTRISLDAVPRRIAASKDVAAALADMGLGDRVVAVFGKPDNPDPDLGLQSPDLDLSSVPDVTGAEESGTLDVEALATARPDLVVTTHYVGDALSFIDPDTRARVEKAYPIAAVTYEGETVEGIVDNAERLGTALGADPAGFEDDHAALAAASDRLRAAARAAGDPTLVATSTTPDLLYVANPAAYGDLRYLREEVGLDVVVPDERDLDEGVYWDALSWENADTYDVDVALWDTRGGRQHLERLQDQPIWGRTTAARDDAYLPWRFEVAPSARGYADVLDAYADDLRSLARS